MSKEDAVLEEILKKYGSQKECAKLLGMSESAFSIALKRGSKKFLIRLKGLGVHIDNSIIQTINGDTGMNYNAAHSKAGQVNENNYFYDREAVSELINTIKFLREQNSKLQTELDACRKKK